MYFIYIRSLKLNLFSVIINPFQHEKPICKGKHDNTTTQVGKKVATSGEQVERVGETAQIIKSNQ